MVTRLRMRGKPSPSLGTALDAAAAHHGPVPVHLDRPLDIDAGGGQTTDLVQLARLVQDASGWLAGAGVRAGDRVAIVKRNSLDVLLLAAAASRLGAVPALLSARLDPTTVPVMLERLGRPVVLTDADAIEHGSLCGVDVDAFARHVLGAGSQADGLLALREAGADRSPPTPRGWQPDDPLLITHTSSTTGVAKLVVHSWHSLLGQVGPQLRFGGPLLRAGDLAALCVSWVHTRSVTAWLTLLSFGVPALTMADDDPDAAAVLLGRHRPAFLETHPNIFLAWERLADHPLAPFANVKVFFSTFDSAHPRTVRRLLGASRRRLPLYLQVYGQSEVGGSTMKISTRGWPLAASDSRSVGRALPGFTRVRVVDPASRRPLPRGQVGVIEVASRGRLLTYLAQDGLADERRRGPWWDMGDLGTLTRTGELRFVDREIDAIEGIESSIELEDLLLERLPAAREVVVVGMPSGLPQPVVCIGGDAPLDVEAWRQAVGGLPDLAAPVQCSFTDLPLTGTYKVRRPELRRRLLTGELVAVTA